MASYLIGLDSATASLFLDLLPTDWYDCKRDMLKRDT
jgi:hypothetical protein